MDRLAVRNFTSIEPGRAEGPSSQRPRVTRRTRALGGLLACVGQVAPWLRADVEREPVTLALDWLAEGTRAGYVLALDRSFHAERCYGGGALWAKRPEARA